MQYSYEIVLKFKNQLLRLNLKSNKLQKQKNAFLKLNYISLINKWKRKCYKKGHNSIRTYSVSARKFYECLFLDRQNDLFAQNVHAKKVHAKNAGANKAHAEKLQAESMHAENE